MSFGFSVGDFINVANVAYQLYERCRASVTEFKDLSRDVKSMHIVLKAIQEFWEEQDRRGQALPASQNASLEELSNDCKEVLVELEGLLDKHGELGAGAGFLSRMKWAPKNIGPLRMRLLARTNSLSAFNNVITASSAMDQQVKSQARILAALNVINYGYHSGKRTAPAYSQAQTERDLDNQEIWKDIVQDLKDEGIDKESLSSQEPFIKSWIEDVIVADEGYVSGDGSQTEDASERASSIALSSFNEVEQYGRFAGNHSPRLTSGGLQEITRRQTAPVLATPMVETRNRRPRQSQGSISSQDYKWRSELPQSSQVQGTLVSLFKLEYGVSREDMYLRGTMEHLFNKLDILKRGLLRRQFEGQFLQAVKSVELRAHDRIADIIHSHARDKESKFDQAAFSELLYEILEYVQATRVTEIETRQRESQAVVEESDSWGEAIAYSWLCSELESQGFEKVLPRSYTSEVRQGIRLYRSVAQDVLCHDTATRNLPKVAMSTFAAMSLLADFCCAQILHILEVWNEDEQMERDYLSNYLGILGDVLEAAHKFDVLNDMLVHDRSDVAPHGKSNEEVNILDRLLGEAEIVEMADASHSQRESCPVLKLREIQYACYHSLQKILGFCFDLIQPPVQQDVKNNTSVQFERGRQGGLVVAGYIETPSTLPQWQSKMKAQAEAIWGLCDGWHAHSEAVISECRDWYIAQDWLSPRADLALKRSEKLKTQAKPCQHLTPKRIEDPIIDKFVCLKLISLKDLPRGPLIFRAQAPNVYAKVIIDGETLLKRFARRDPDKAYYWSGAPYHITAHAKSVIQIRFFNDHRRDRDDEGFMGLIHLPVSSFVTTVKARPQTAPLPNSFYKGTDPPAKLTFAVHWCPTAQLLRQQGQPADLFHGHWARRDTADGRFCFEDSDAVDTGPGSRTAIFERVKDSVNPDPTRLRVTRTT